MTNPLLTNDQLRFAEKHGGDCINIEGWLVFSDGAMMLLSGSGQMKEPPADELGLGGTQ